MRFEHRIEANSANADSDREDTRGVLFLKLGACFLILLAATPYLLLGVRAIYHGRFVADEGFYSLAAANVYAGMIPYRDFLFTQTPLLPYVYGAFFSFLDSSVITGRWLSYFLGLGSIVLTAAVCYRRAGLFAALVATALLGTNFSLISDMTKVVTQSLTVFLSSAVVFALGCHRRKLWIIASVLAMTLACLARLSLLPGLILLWGYLFWREREHPSRDFLWFVVIGSAAILLVLSLFFFSNGNLFFGIYSFHTEDGGDLSQRFTSLLMFILKAGANQLPVLVAFIWSMVGLVVRARADKDRDSDQLLIFCAVVFAVITVIHAAPVIPYAGYQTSIVVFPVVAAALGMPPVDERIARRWIAGILTAVVFLGIPLQTHWIYDNAGTPVQLREATDILRRIARPGQTILTPNTELALQSDLKLLSGYELGEFSYFPSMDEARAEQLRVVNKMRFLKDLKFASADIICFTPYYLRVFSGNEEPYVRSLIARNYEPIHMVNGYGQFQEPLWIFKKKPNRN